MSSNRELNAHKRILIIGLTERMGGVETFIYNTTMFSDKSKYVYDFLVHGADHCVFEEELRKFYDDGEQHIFFIRKYKENPFGCVSDLREFYKNNGERYDYIHFQSGSTAEILYVWPFCKLYHIEVIAHSHNGNGYNPVINAIFRPIVNHVASKRIACSKVAAEWLFGKKYRDESQIVINGIDTDRFTYNVNSRQSIRKQYNIDDDQLVVGHIGRFSEQKNHAFILDVFSEVKKQVDDAVLMLVGVGELMDAVKKKTDELKLNDSVIFAGKQLKTEDYYSAFDLFLMPSLYEGLPIVGVEAQCEGLNCFFSDQIDKQILITSNAKMVSLNNKSSEWASLLISAKNTDRIASVAEVTQKDYSIKSTVLALQKIYEVD